MWFDANFERDSVVQLLNICQPGRPFTLTRHNIFDVELLCKEWKITDKRVLDEVKQFIQNLPGDGGLAVARPLFCLRLRLGSEDVEDEIRRCLTQFVGDDELVQFPVAIVACLVDFSVYLDDSQSCDRVLNFYIEYFRMQSVQSSQIFRTLDVGRLGTEQLERMGRLEVVPWCGQDGSLVSDRSSAAAGAARTRNGRVIRTTQDSDPRTRNGLGARTRNGSRTKARNV
jgi:hypothetical protein